MVGLLFLGLLVLGLLIALLVIIWFTALRVELVYKREQGNDRGEIILTAWRGLIRYRIAIPQMQWKGLDQGVKVNTRASMDKMIGNGSAEQHNSEVKVNKRLLKRLNSAYKEMVRNVSGFHQILRWFLTKITCEKLVWKSRIGTGDAAEAGILTGMAWAIKSTLIGWFCSRVKCRHQPQITVDPEFHAKVWDTHVNGIIRFRIGHAIIAIKRLLVHMRKGRVR